MYKIILSIFIFLSFAAKSQNITVKDMIEYEKQCYNDSTARYYYLVCDNGCYEVPCNKGDKSFFGECPIHWEHKKPTFEGFIIWIKKKDDS